MKPFWNCFRWTPNPKVSTNNNKANNICEEIILTSETFWKKSYFAAPSSVKTSLLVDELKPRFIFMIWYDKQFPATFSHLEESLSGPFLRFFGQTLHNRGSRRRLATFFHTLTPNISRKAFIKKVSFEIDIYDYMIYKAKAQLRIAVLSVLYTLKFKMF